MQLDPHRLWRQFLGYALPSVAAQWVFSLYVAVDGWFVARGVSATALAAVNLASPFPNFLFALSAMFGIGTSTLVSIRLGEGRPEAADRILTQNLLFMEGLAVGIFLLAEAFPAALAGFLGAEAQTLPDTVCYLRTLAPFAPCFGASYLFEILLKADGRPRMAVVMVTGGCLLNGVLDALLVLWLRWGVFGAALATGLSQASVVGVYLRHFLGGHSRLRLCPFRFDAALQLRSALLGLPGGITEWSAGITTFLFNHAITRWLGESALVSYTLVGYVNVIVVMGMAGIAQGAQPLISFAHGRGQPELARRLLRCGMISVLGMGVVGVALCQLFAEGYAGLFLPADSELLAPTAAALRLFSLSLLPVGVNVMIPGYLTAIERPGGSLLVSVLRGAVAIGAALALLPPLVGGAGIWLAAAASECACLPVTAWVWAGRAEPRE